MPYHGINSPLYRKNFPLSSTFKEAMVLRMLEALKLISSIAPSPPIAKRKTKSFSEVASEMRGVTACLS